MIGRAWHPWYDQRSENISSQECDYDCGKENDDGDYNHNYYFTNSNQNDYKDVFLFGMKTNLNSNHNDDR